MHLGPTGNSIHVNVQHPPQQGAPQEDIKILAKRAPPSAQAKWAELRPLFLPHHPHLCVGTTPLRVKNSIQADGHWNSHCHGIALNPEVLATAISPVIRGTAQQKYMLKLTHIDTPTKHYLEKFFTLFYVKTLRIHEKAGLEGIL